MMKLKLLFISLLLFLSGCTQIHRHKEKCKVLTIEKQVEQQGSSESFSTRIYWLVVTDNGTYNITTKGLWSCPEALGKLKEDSTYLLTIDGFYESSILGLYPYIVKVEDHE